MSTAEAGGDSLAAAPGRTRAREPEMGNAQAKATAARATDDARTFIKRSDTGKPTLIPAAGAKRAVGPNVEARER